MPIVKQTPADVKDSRLFRRLEEINGSSGLGERVSTFVSAATPMLDLVIAGPFRTYTLHNPAHAKKLVHLAEYIIDETTIDQLTALELSVFIMACYLHDLGMSLTETERAQLLGDASIEEELRSWPQLYEDLTVTRAKQAAAIGVEKLQLETRLFQLQEAALSTILRPRHATKERYQGLTARLKTSTGREDLFSLNGVSFESELIDICVSHNLDATCLLETIDAYTDRFPRALTLGGMHLNAQFLAAVLRLVDILDFDRERTPRILFESLGVEDTDIPGGLISLSEWNKHMAVHSIDIELDEIVVSADSTHPAIERSIRDFCVMIEREIRDTIAVLRRNPEKILATYRLKVPVLVRPQLRSVGYVYKNLAFQFDESAISALLMGEGLYSDKAVALRELVQNGIDACRVRKLVDKDATYEPVVKVSWEADHDERIWLIVADNGIGMDESVLTRFFFSIGTSYYKSQEFERISRSSMTPFEPISRFGIGILSVFMVGDRLEVQTRNQFSPRADTVFRIVRVDGRFGLAFVTERDAGPQGTTVRVRLNLATRDADLGFLRDAGKFVRDRITRPPIPVSVHLPTDDFVARPGTFVSLTANAIERLAERDIEPVVLEVERWSPRMSGRVILFFHRDTDRTLSNLGVSVQAATAIPPEFLRNYHGNRITVNGVAMALKRIGRIFGRQKHRFAAAVDVELAGSSDVQYNVARDRLTGGGAAIARRELRRVVSQGLRDLGLYARFDPETKDDLDALVELDAGGAARQLVGEELLAMVEREVPQGAWPRGLHRMIADRLGISPTQTSKALKALLASGRVNNNESIEPSREPAAGAGHGSPPASG